jgi:hypothetical protein
VILWEGLTNAPLFQGTPSECLAQVMFKDIPAPSALRSRVPADLEAIAMRLLERERDARFPNAEAAVEALLRCEDAPRNGRDDLARMLAERFPDAQARRTGGVTGQPRGLMAQQFAVPSPLSTLGGAASQSMTSRGSRRGLFVAFAVALVAAAAVTLVVATKRSTTEVAQTTPPVVADAARVAVAVDAPLAPAMVPIDAGAPIVDAGTATAVPHTHTQVVQAQGAGVLDVFVTPWAVGTLDGKSLGQTPIHLVKVGAGHHSLRLANDEAGKHETISITITADHTTTIQRNW